MKDWREKQNDNTIMKRNTWCVCAWVTLLYCVGHSCCRRLFVPHRDAPVHSENWLRRTKKTTLRWACRVEPGGQLFLLAFLAASQATVVTETLTVV